MNQTLIRLGHSPDADDAFMFWALAEERIETPLRFEHDLRDIQTLNEWSREGRLEFTAISVHNLAYVADQYAVLVCGGSFGDGYGPMLVAREPFSREELARQTIVVPGLLTSAYLALKLFLPEAQTRVMPFDEIQPAVEKGEAAVGLLIHEGQLTHQQAGLKTLVDLGVWWGEVTGGLPLPLGVNVVRRDLGETVMQEIARVMKETIRMSLTHRADALRYALQFGRGIDPNTADQFVGMYVNEMTINMGERGRRSIELFLQRGSEAGITPKADLVWVE